MFEPNPGSRVYYCKACRNLRQKERTAAMTPTQKAARAERQREWIAKNPDYYPAYYAKRRTAIRERHLQRSYGIGLAEYERMLKAQNGKCAICSVSQGESAFAVDHDHETAVVRSLLCTRCNQAVGFLRDSTTLARQLAEYLEGHGR